MRLWLGACLPLGPGADPALFVDERPYKCAKCGKSFRESGALTRHLKSLTPCTEKIRFSASKDVLVGKEDTPAGPRGRGSPPWPGPGCCPGQRSLQGLSWFCLKGSGASTVGTVTSSSVTGEPMETSPVIHLVTDAKGTVIHEVHVQMQELPLGMKALAPEVRAGQGLASVRSVPGSVPVTGSSGNGTKLACLPGAQCGCRGDRRPMACQRAGRGEGQGAGGEVEWAVGLPKTYARCPWGPLALLRVVHASGYRVSLPAQLPSVCLPTAPRLRGASLFR